MKKIVLEKSDYIKVSQALKLAGIINMGGEAKLLISENKVKLNGETVTQRGKKVYENDIISVEGHDDFCVSKK